MTDVVRVDPRPGAKLAQVVAGRIEADILDRGDPVGTVVGSESDLLAHYGVSRGVFREAIRLVEYKQVAKMRRGRGGGLVVTEPDDRAVVDAAAVYMCHAGTGLDELFEARRIVEGAATELAASAISEDDFDSLRAASTGSDLQELHRLLGRLTGNPAIDTFCGLLVRLTALYVGSLRGSKDQRRGHTAASHDAHDAIVDALLAGNAGLAAHRMEVHLAGLEEVLRVQRASPTVIAGLLGRHDETEGETKLAADLATTVLRSVADDGWPVGDVLGSESELQARYGVSRAVLREAVRILEFHQVARMRRGPGGGLVVTAPAGDAVAEAMAVLLEYRAIGPRHLAPLRTVVEVACAELAAERIDDAGRQALEVALDHERCDSGADLNVVSHGLHRVLADIAGNRVLALFLDVLVRVSARHTPTRIAGRTAKGLRNDVFGAHDRIAEAVLAGDPALARHRMHRHMEALVPHFI